MKIIGKGLWVVLFGVGVIFSSGLTLVFAEGSISKDFEEETQRKKKVKKKSITAICDINPNRLNVKSKGKWITAYIELPKDYDPQDIVIGEILLNNFLSPEIKLFNIEDRDSNGISELMIKFDRSSVIENLEPSQFNEMTITGKLINGIRFEGRSIIEVNNFM